MARLTNQAPARRARSAAWRERASEATNEQICDGTGWRNQWSQSGCGAGSRSALKVLLWASLSSARFTYLFSMWILQCFRFGPVVQPCAIPRCTNCRTEGTPAGVFRPGSDHGDDGAVTLLWAIGPGSRKCGPLLVWWRWKMPGRTSFPQNASVTRPNSYPVRDPASCRSP